jgi:exodeoxyribonuclease VIII
MAAYYDALALSGTTPRETVLVCVEKAAPYDVAVWQLDGEPLAMGREQYRSALKTLAECLASGEWPGRFPALQQFDVPGWAYPDVEREADSYDDEQEDSFDE